MNQSTINSAKSKFDVFYERFEKFYDLVIPWLLFMSMMLALLLLTNEWLV